MGRKIDVESIRNEKDVRRYARQEGMEVVEGKNHGIVVSPKGKCAFPRHPGDFCTGTRFSIIKTLSLMTILLVIGLVLMQVI